MAETWTWLGIALCLSQSATLSGLNLAVFSLSRLRLEAAAEAGDAAAARVLALRRQGHFTLVTILWGNVGVNVLLTLLADSVLAGVAAFLFSTVAITLLGEILPQALLSRHALRAVSLLAPVLRGYQLLLWPVARPTGLLLDALVGAEPIPWFGEEELRGVLRHQARAGTEVGHLEATGALNFLALDDLPVGQEGEPLDPASVLALPFRDGRPVFPGCRGVPDDPFLRRIAAAGRKWIVVVDEADEPRLVLNAHELLRAALFGAAPCNPAAFCHRPLVLRDEREPLGHALARLTVHPERPGDDVIDEDLILLWGSRERRIVTGSDLLGRLLRGIARTAPAAPRA